MPSVVRRRSRALAALACATLPLLSVPAADAVTPADVVTAASSGGAVAVVPNVTTKATTALAARPLRRGARGGRVRSMQQLLRRAGFATRVDGRYGPATARAVRLFERANGLAVDGVLSPADLGSLSGLAALAGSLARSAAPVEPVPGEKAVLNPDGTATPPASAPPQVQAIIEAGNDIATKPYKYGGGHGKWKDRGYDCSGSVSYALHGGGLLDAALPSGSFTSWGQPGPGRWVTIYANGGHMYMVVAGLRFDTSGRTKAGTRWQADMRSARGYRVRHPPGL